MINICLICNVFSRLLLDNGVARRVFMHLVNLSSLKIKNRIP